MVRLRKKAHQLPSSPDPSITPASKMPGEPGIADGLHLGGGGVSSWSTRSQWIFFAVASGACAAFNGVFAKLTTTDLTTGMANGIADFFGLSSAEKIVEYCVRGMFFALNLVFNGIMWSLFTTALARGTSTTQVSIMNTSTNFMLTALLGLFIFSESLPLLWWLGASLLVAGNVIIGRKDETADGAGAAAAEDGAAYAPVSQQDSAEQEVRKSDDEDVIDLGDLPEGRDR